MIAMGAMSFGGRAYLLLRGLPLCLVFLCGGLLGFVPGKKSPKQMNGRKPLRWGLFAIFLALGLMTTYYALCYGGRQGGPRL